MRQELQKRIGLEIAKCKRNINKILDDYIEGDMFIEPAQAQENTELRALITVAVDRAYAIYPRKSGKTAALKRLTRGEYKLKNLTDISNFHIAVENYTMEMQVQSVDQQYIKHFNSFVSEWQDWVDHVPVIKQDNRKEW